VYSVDAAFVDKQQLESEKNYEFQKKLPVKIGRKGHDRGNPNNLLK
jgi:hypothetical protein